jgi:heme-degrading monooxygenase HmoA
MTTVYTSGTWQSNPGSEQAFVKAWEEFATWASRMPGAGSLRLVRDLTHPERFQSFGDWQDIDQVRAWKSLPEFRERIAHVLQHVGDFKPTELELVTTAEHGAIRRNNNRTVSVRYRKEAIATFDASPDTLFQYMRSGGHPHAAFKSHRLIGLDGNLVTVAAELYNPDGSTFETTIEHRLDPPSGIETTMHGGPFDGARFVHSYTTLGERTKVDLEGYFPPLPGVSEADELAMIDSFFTTVFDEDTATLSTWSPAE